MASAEGGPASSPAITPIAYRPNAEQNVVRIWQNSALGIDKLTSTDTGADVVTETQLDLRAGRVLDTVKKMNSASKYEIKLPNGVAGIRGTCYDLWANGLFRIGNGSGVISIIGADNQPNTKVVPGGYEFDPGTGQLNPLPQSVINSLNKLETQSRVVSAPQMTTFTADRTVHHVSHHHGHHGGDGQGDGGGPNSLQVSK